MAFWHWEDHRYRQERILLLFSLFGIVVGPAVLLWLFLHETPAPIVYPVHTEAAAPVSASTGPEQAEVDLWVRDFHAALDGQDRAVALEVGRRILAVRPDTEAVVTYLGHRALEEGHLEEALAIYDRAIEAHSSLQPYYIYQKALALRKVARFAEAVAVMQHGIRRDPSNVGLNNCLILAQIEAGQVQAVRDEIRSYEMLDSDLQKAQWLLGSAALALHEGEFARARELIADFQNRVPPSLCDTLLNDPYFDQYRSNPATLSYLLVSRFSMPENPTAPASF